MWRSSGQPMHGDIRLLIGWVFYDNIVRIICWGEDLDGHNTFNSNSGRKFESDDCRAEVIELMVASDQNLSKSRGNCTSKRI